MKYDGKNSKAFNYIDSQYVFRFNVVTGFYEFRKRKKKSKWKLYDDRFKNNLLLELMAEYIEISDNKVNTFIESIEFSPDYNPFEEYFESLPKKKKKKNYIKKLAKTVQTDNDKRFAKTLERFLVGCIDCLMRTDSVNDVCLVFQSKQGLGKTRWMRSLLPKQFQSEYLYEGNIDTSNKDHVMYLSQYWFIHLDELEALNGNDIKSIKSYITRQRISVRKAYGRYNSHLIRRASFLGSVNDNKFLSDMTGNRRWLVFKVKGIDYMHKINPDDVWGQAYQLWKKGYRHWFDMEEIGFINDQNEKFRNVGLEEELLLRYFTFNKKEGLGELLSSSEVIEKIIVNVPAFTSKLYAVKMGKALSKHSKYKKQSSGVQRYFVNYEGVDAPVSSPSPVSHSKNKEIGEDDDLPF
jgi:predicted P-loop ATPase